MFTSRKSSDDLGDRQGGRWANLSELRHELAKPSQLTDGHRQRLVDLAQRVARVQELGEAYTRVSLSEYVTAVIGERVAGN